MKLLFITLKGSRCITIDENMLGFLFLWCSVSSLIQYIEDFRGIDTKNVIFNIYDFDSGFVLVLGFSSISIESKHQKHCYYYYQIFSFTINSQNCFVQFFIFYLLWFEFLFLYDIRLKREIFHFELIAIVHPIKKKRINE